MKVVEMELGGQLRRLAFDWNASIAIQEESGEHLGEILARLRGDEGELPADEVERKRALGKRNLERLKLIRLLVWAAVQTSSPGVSQAEVGSWLSGLNPVPVMEALAKVLGGGAGEEFEGQLAPYVPTPPAVVQAMVRLAQITDDSLVIDMGAGDGRLLFAAAGAAQRVTALGYEKHQGRFDALRDKVLARGFGGQVLLKSCDIQDALELDAGTIKTADVVFLYLLDGSNMLLRDRLRAVMKPGARIISHDFGMGDWQPDTTETVMAEDRTHKVYRWVIGDEKSAVPTV